MAMDLNDGVVDIEQPVPGLLHDGVGAHGRTGAHPQESGQSGQCDQEPGGDRVELTDMAEGERPQERPQRRGRVSAGEDPAHRPVPQERHVVDRVRAGDHPADQGSDLQSSVRALVGRHREVLISQSLQPCGVGQREHRNQAAGRHEIRIVERH
jgi:hypothetical protein